jgi:hypothetical protein
MRYNPTKQSALGLFLALSLCLSLSLQASDDLPEITEDGLQRMQDTDLALVYADPEADLGVYHRIKLLDPGIAFKKNWQRNQNRSDAFKVRAKDMEKIKSGLSQQFRKVFTEELTEGGYELTDETGPDVLLVRPAIVNLDITAPDTNHATRIYQYSESAGEMTLYVELYDSETSALIAKAMDRKRDREQGYLEWRNRVSNTQAAKRILRSWAKTLREALDEARAPAKAG